MRISVVILTKILPPTKSMIIHTQILSTKKLENAEYNNLYLVHFIPSPSKEPKKVADMYKVKLSNSLHETLYLPKTGESYTQWCCIVRTNLSNWIHSWKQVCKQKTQMNEEENAQNSLSRMLSNQNAYHDVVRSCNHKRHDIENSGLSMLHLGNR